MSNRLTAEGGCLCGAIRYRVHAAPRAKTLCHCRSCRLAAGAPTLAWAIFRRADVEFLHGTPQEFRSSPPALRGFCAKCGTTLTYRTSARPDDLDLTTATFDDASRFAPECEIFVAERLAWQTVSSGLRQFVGSSRGG